MQDVAAFLDKVEDPVSVEKIRHLAAGQTLCRSIDLHAEDLELDRVA